MLDTFLSNLAQLALGIAGGVLANWIYDKIMRR